MEKNKTIVCLLKAITSSKVQWVSNTSDSMLQAHHKTNKETELSKQSNITQTYKHARKQFIQIRKNNRLSLHNKCGRKLSDNKHLCTEVEQLRKATNPRDL